MWRRIAQAIHTSDTLSAECSDGIGYGLHRSVLDDALSISHPSDIITSKHKSQVSSCLFERY